MLYVPNKYYKEMPKLMMALERRSGSWSRKASRALMTEGWVWEGLLGGSGRLSK